MLASRSTRPQVLMGAAATFSIVLAYHFLTSGAAVVPADATHLRSPEAPSAWLCDDGYLEWSAVGDWGTQYSVLKRDSEGYTCDMEETLPNGQGICRNNIIALKRLWSNTQAQQRHFADLDRAGSEEPPPPPPSFSENNAAQFQSTFTKISDIAGKRLLVIGDSLDRDWITELVDLTAPSSYFRNYDLSSYRPNPAPDNASEPALGVTKRALPFKFDCGTAIIPVAASSSQATNETSIAKSFLPRYTPETPQPDHHFRIDFAFAFGLLNDGSKPSQPGNTSDRIAALQEVIGGASGADAVDVSASGYDAITINFGLWDFVGFQRRAYLENGKDDQPGLTVEWIAEYSEACETFIRNLRDYYGHHVHIYFRLVHASGPGAVGVGAFDLPPHLEAAFVAAKVPTFKPLRVAQLRRAQMLVAERMGLRTLNFARRFEGYGTEITRDGTHPVKQANKVQAELVLRQLMAQ